MLNETLHFYPSRTRITTGDTWPNCRNKVLKMKNDEIQRGSEGGSQVASLAPELAEGTHYVPAIVLFTYIKSLNSQSYAVVTLL